MSSDDRLSSDISSWSDVELLQSVREGDGSFNSIVWPYQIADMGERDITEKDEDDEGAIRFATLESRFENRETVRNWLTIKPLCLQHQKMSKAPYALAIWPDLTTSVAVVPNLTDKL